jgi:four helix bundle protein
MAFRDFTSMPLWQKGLALLVKVYELTRSFPTEEKYGMISDMRRSANSVIHNVAEGFGRFEKKDKTRFYKISRGSAYEIISHTFTSHILCYLDNEDKEYLINGYKEIIDEEDRLIKSIETRKTP